MILNVDERRWRLGAVAAAFAGADEAVLRDWRAETDDWTPAESLAEPLSDGPVSDETSAAVGQHGLRGRGHLPTDR